MPVYMGGSHRTTDMSLTANKGRGRNDGGAVGRVKKREGKETVRGGSNKTDAHLSAGQAQRQRLSCAM